MSEIKGSEFARVKLSTRIELGIDSDGIDPLVEPVTVDFEPYITTGDSKLQCPRTPPGIRVIFPAGVFQQTSDGYVARDFNGNGGQVLFLFRSNGIQVVDITQGLIVLEARMQVNRKSGEVSFTMEAVFGDAKIVSPCLIVSLIGGANDVSLSIGNDGGTAERKKVEASGA